MIVMMKVVPARHLTPAWLKYRSRLMRSLLEAKFNQCQEFKEEITNHGTFLEDTFNDYWGRGQHNNGSNVLGVLMNQVRSKLVPHLVVIGDSHLRDIPHSVKQIIKASHPSLESAHVEFGVGTNSRQSFLTTVSVNPGITISRLRERIIQHPDIISPANHIVVHCGYNDIAKDVDALISNLQRLKSVITVINPDARLFISAILPSLDITKNSKITDANNMISKTFFHAYIPHKMTRNGKAKKFFFKDQTHMTPAGAERLWKSIQMAVFP